VSYVCENKTDYGNIANDCPWPFLKLLQVGVGDEKERLLDTFPVVRPNSDESMMALRTVVQLHDSIHKDDKDTVI